MPERMFKEINVLGPGGKPLRDPKTGKPISVRVPMTAEEIEAFEVERAALVARQEGGD